MVKSFAFIYVFVLMLPYGTTRITTTNFSQKQYFVFSGGLSLAEALQIVYDEEVEVEKIFVESPDRDMTVSGEEDGGWIVDNLSKNQLKAAAELVIHGRDEETIEENIENNQMDMENEDIDLDIDNRNNNSASTVELHKVGMTKTKWISGDIVSVKKLFPNPSYENLKL